tara:strand:- start:99712 stop:100569 length:858 start_codon:yes stop_codon:yes gene_type:complete
MSSILKNLVRRALAWCGYDIVEISGRDRASSAENELARLESLPDYSVCESDILGFKVTFPSNHIFSILYREIFIKQCYAFRTKHEVPYVLDCGANVGLMSLFVKREYPNAEVIAFEPHPETFKCVQQNFSNSGYDHLRVIEKGVWSSDTTLKLVEDKQSTAASVVGNPLTDNPAEDSKPIDIAVTTLRPYLSKPVSMLKLDIEGAELEVLESIEDLLPTVENIFVECHSYAGKDQNLHKVLSILHDAGFRLYIGESGPTQTMPLVQRRIYKGMDMFANIYGCRVP